jgi:hypothetical protein
MLLRNLIRPLWVAMSSRRGTRKGWKSRQWMPVGTMALCLALACGKAACATISDQLTADIFDPKTGKTNTKVVQNLFEGTTEMANFTLPQQVLMFPEVVGGKPSTTLVSDIVTIGPITGTIKSDSGGEPSNDSSEGPETLFSLGFESNATDTLTATGLKGVPANPLIKLTEGNEGKAGKITIPKQQFTVGKEGDDVVTLNAFDLLVASDSGPDPKPDDSESKDPIFSLKFGSDAPVVPEAGTLFLIGAVLLGVALRAAQWRFGRKTSPI